MARTRRQMLLHLLEISHADDNNEVLLVGPEGREANTNSPVLLLDGSDEDSDKRSAHIDGMSDDNSGDDNDNREKDGTDIVGNNDDGDNDDAADDADDNKGTGAGQENDNNDAGQDNAGNNEDADGGHCNDGADNDADAGEGGDKEDNDGGMDADSAHDAHYEEEENAQEDDNAEEDDKNVDTLFQEVEDMDQNADSQLTFVSLPGALPTSPIFTYLIADMLCPAITVLSSPTLPVDSLATQDAELYPPFTSPVVAALSQFLVVDRRF
jgi:hypothetical protein